jgi:TPP-dependent pyruvate/acetoin dehydrogenase alpha subunit
MAATRGPTAEWLRRDPIPLLRGRLVEAGVAEADLDAIDAEVAAAVAAAEAFARSSPEPDAAVLGTQVWADGGSACRTDGTGS